MNDNKSYFITFEGGDGTGKSTQVKLLTEALKNAGVDVVLSREPGGTPQAERIRNLLLQRDSGHFDPMTEALMMFASRREHLVDKIWPALDEGKWVISDRFADSTRVFQGYGLGLEVDTIEKLYEIVAGNFHPDLTFIFDIDPEIGLARSMKQLAATTNKTEATEDRYERMGLPFHKRLRGGFIEIARKYPERCVLINGLEDIPSVHRKVLSVISERFGVQLNEVAIKEAASG